MAFAAVESLDYSSLSPFLPCQTCSFFKSFFSHARFSLTQSLWLLDLIPRELLGTSNCAFPSRTDPMGVVMVTTKLGYGNTGGIVGAVLEDLLGRGTSPPFIKNLKGQRALTRDGSGCILT